MKIDINNNISISSNWDFLENKHGTNNMFLKKPLYEIFEDKFIWIQKKKFRIINLSELMRKRNEKDGYYRVIYIQINFETGEYYIGKANRPTWKQLQRYQGSGLKFKEKYKKHQNQFIKYYIAICKSAEETEKIESSIVNESLLLDEKCLNLVQGGGGTTKHPSMQELREKKRLYMKQHPEQYKRMVEIAKKIFSSGETPELKARNRQIAKTMSGQKYKEMSRNRILKWKEDNPIAYEKARQKNKESIQKQEVQEKRKRSLQNWIKNNPDKYQQWQQKRKLALQSKESKEKQKRSLKNWIEKHPKEAIINSKRRTEASVKTTIKPVAMIDLKTNQVLKEFVSARDAARWLLCENKTKSPNAAGSISSVCLGRRQKAYDYLWHFIKNGSKSN